MKKQSAELFKGKKFLVFIYFLVLVGLVKQHSQLALQLHSRNKADTLGSCPSIRQSDSKGLLV